MEILADEMTRMKNEVVILTSRYKKELKSREKGIVRSIVLFSIGKGVLMPFFWLDAMREVRKCDVVNCHLPQFESFILAICAKIFKKKLIVTHHCEFNFTGSIGNMLISAVTYPFHLITYLLADKIIAYTQDYAETSIFLKHFSNKIAYILPSIKLENGVKKFDFGKDKIVAYVGRIGWEKGLDVLVEAMKQVEAKLVIAGPYKNVVGDETYKKLKNTILYGPLKRGVLRSFYENIDCLVLPSTNSLETFGLVQAEAMICGCPVVASNLPGVRMPVQLTGMGEIARPGDVKDLAKKINKVLQTKYPESLTKKARKIFDLEIFTKKYQECLN